MWMSDLAFPSLLSYLFKSAWAARMRRSPSRVSPSPVAAPTWRNIRRLGGAKWEGSSFHVIGRMGQAPKLVEDKRRGRAGQSRRGASGGSVRPVSGSSHPGYGRVGEECPCHAKAKRGRGVSQPHAVAIGDKRPLAEREMIPRQEAPHASS